MEHDTKQKALDKLARELETLPLYQGMNFVFGEGDPDAAIMFIGEAPGQKENELKRPFVGAAGKFLDKLLESIGLTRNNVYITNIVKQRPPNNRDPEPREIETHWPLLEKQIEIIHPKIIITLGRHSMNKLLPNVGTISQIHGTPYRRKDGRVYLPLFHPAVALYNANQKDVLFEDFRKIPLVLQKLNQKT